MAGNRFAVFAATDEGDSDEDKGGFALATEVVIDARLSSAVKLGGERDEGVEVKTETAAASSVVGELAAESAGIRHDLQWTLDCAGRFTTMGCLSCKWHWRHGWLGRWSIEWRHRRRSGQKQ